MTKPINKFKGVFHFLSNFHLDVFEWRGEMARSSEHHYQASKALHPQDAFRIRTAPTPGVSKEWGKLVERRPDFDDIKVDLMYEIVLAKFTQLTNLREKLLATGDAELIEGNNHGDTFWGTVNGKGHNKLGKILMRVREELRVTGDPQ